MSKNTLLGGVFFVFVCLVLFGVCFIQRINAQDLMCCSHATGSCKSICEKRVAAALKISKKIVYSVKKRKENNPVLYSPGKTKCRPKHKTTDLPDTTKMTSRNTLYDMYKERKHVTVSTLNSELRRNEIIHMGKSSLKILLKDIGFKFKKEDNRRALMERVNIAANRGEFLRKYKENMNSQVLRETVFLDETWIYAKGSKRMSWQDDNIKSIRKPEGYDGKRFIVLHAGSKNGFVRDADLLFASAIFTKWVNDRFIPNLEEPSLIIMDNAPYHSMLVEKQLASSWRKSEIIDWLKKYKINYNKRMTVPELLFLAKQYKKSDKYVIDKLLQAHGHEVLRLPPYHCEFNAIELIWAKSKAYYNDNIGRDGYGDDKVLGMWKEALATCSENIWENCVRHTEKVINEWYDRENFLLEIDIEPLIISVDNNDTTSESESN